MNQKARQYDRPAELVHPSINIFKPSTFDIEPIMDVCDEDTQATLALGSFKSVDSGGPFVATHWSCDVRPDCFCLQLLWEFIDRVLVAQTRTKLYDTHSLQGCASRRASPSGAAVRAKPSS